MKKVLVMLLAAAMMLAVVPFAFAEGPEDIEAPPIEEVVACEACAAADCACRESCFEAGAYNCSECTCEICAVEAPGEEEPADPYACIPECLRPLFDFLAPYIGEKIANVIYKLTLKAGFKVLLGFFGF